MQILTAAPRDSLTAAQVTAVLQASALQVDVGLEVLDSANVVTDDISADLVPAGSTVSRECYATVHGTCNLNVSRALQWGAERVRPYMTLSTGSTSARWNLGAFLLTTPDNNVAESPTTYAAVGYDLLYLLDQQIRDSVQYASGADVLTSVRAVIAAAGVTSPVLLDGTASGKTLSADMVWTPSSSSVPTYLDVVNKLLATVSYWGLWADQDGNLRSEPYLAPANRAVEWTWTADDAFTSLIAEARTISQDLWPVPNWWRFMQNGLTSAPVEGAGQYTYQTPNSDATSQATLGYFKPKWQWLDAADQASLQAQGDAIVQADRQVTMTYKTTVAPFPAFGHMDVYSVLDTAAGGTYKVLGHSWTLPLDGSDCTVQWDVIV